MLIINNCMSYWACKVMIFFSFFLSLLRSISKMNTLYNAKFNLCLLSFSSNRIPFIEAIQHQNYKILKDFPHSFRWIVISIRGMKCYFISTIRYLCLFIGLLMPTMRSKMYFILICHNRLIMQYDVYDCYLCLHECILNYRVKSASFLSRYLYLQWLHIVHSINFNGIFFCIFIDQFHPVLPRCKILSAYMLYGWTFE